MTHRKDLSQIVRIAPKKEGLSSGYICMRNSPALDKDSSGTKCGPERESGPPSQNFVEGLSSQGCRLFAAVSPQGDRV